MGVKKLVVKLDYLLVENMGEATGDSVEVHGRLGVGRIAVDPETGEVETLSSFKLFDRSSKDAQTLFKGTEYVVDSHAELEVSSGEILQFTGHLSARDSTGVDRQLGPGFELRYRFDEISDDVLHLGPFAAEDGLSVKVKESVTLDRQG